MASYWIDTLVLKTEGNTYATVLHHPFLFKGKQMQAQEVARRISGTVAGEAYAKSSQDLLSRQRAISGAIAGEADASKSTIPSTHRNPYLSHYIICLSFSSPPLHPCRFIRPLFPVLLSLSFAFCVLVC